MDMTRQRTLRTWMVASLVLSACQAGPGRQVADPLPERPVSGLPDRADGGSASEDGAFITAMARQHQAVADLASAAVPFVTDGDVEELAMTVVRMQQAGIVKMTTVAIEEYDATPFLGGGDALSLESEDMAVTMDVSADVAELAASSMPDRTFLQMVLTYYASSVVLADQAIGRNGKARLRSLAEDLRREHIAQMGDMQALLDRIR